MIIFGYIKIYTYKDITLWDHDCHILSYTLKDSESFNWSYRQSKGNVLKHLWNIYFEFD